MTVMNNIDRESILSLDKAIKANEEMVQQIMERDLKWCTTDEGRNRLMKTVCRLNMDIRRMVRIRMSIINSSRKEEKNYE